ncbi:putative UDP-glucuronate 4-epimerase [Helianthus annuus]|nr:putative UDP-glucuronate 4-epimerase [Helianthus annuus]
MYGGRVGGINDDALLKKLFELIPFTHVVHLAAQADVRYTMENPSSYVHSNIAGFVNLLSICKIANPQPAIVCVSSSSVYGLNTKIPFSEKDRTNQPASLYAATKKVGEEIAHSYNHICGLSLTRLQFFTVYGPLGRPDMAYFFHKRYTKREGDPGFRGGESQDDTAEKNTGSGRKKRGPAQLRVFNLGNTPLVPVSDLVGILERLWKVKARRMVMKLPRNGDVSFTHADISLARREFGYRTTTDLQTGLEKFVRWCVSYYGAGNVGLRFLLILIVICLF